MNMTVDSTNEIFDLAYAFVAHTKASLFLTGKAGTGKTTFLKYVREHVSKNMMIVAPTGVAAINAGGVTLHSFFQLPMGTYVADLPQGFHRNEQAVNRHHLIKNLRINAQKRAIMNQLDVLIIDEVSMLRSDKLDAIDEVLRFVRKSREPFGGVQMVYIGDLQQLPPVVTNDEQELMDTHYDSPFFFDAKVLQQYPPVLIELKKIYRQQEQRFIDLLNKVRNNQLNEADYNLLNSRYQAAYRGIDNGVITLTSHNQKAISINEKALADLSGKLFEFQGRVNGDFHERQFPTEMNLRLKIGAQVMFVKNDSSVEKRWFNGKIVRVENIDDDGIHVVDESGKWQVCVGKETWQQIRYEVDEKDGRITEKVIGEFEQYPLKLAWAITIHKSQGLTFDRVVIDAGDSFAAGQVYVALSRCTSLDGLVLQSRILPSAIHRDERITRFHLQEVPASQLRELLVVARHDAQIQQANRLFSCAGLIEEADALLQIMLDEYPWAETKPLENIQSHWHRVLPELHETAEKFSRQRQRLVDDYQQTGNSQFLVERFQKGVVYFSQFIYNEFLLPTLEFDREVPTRKIFQPLKDALYSFRLNTKRLLDDFGTFSWDGLVLWPADKPRYDLPSTTTASPPKVKHKKGDSTKETLVYFQSGKNAEEIAQIRKLAKSTIETHLCQLVEEGQLPMDALMSELDVQTIQRAIDIHTEASVKELVEKLDNQYPYNFIRLVMKMKAGI
ncbi:MAG: helix-turn-helix domain-containing protein [Chitinophagaceae bacterium]